MSQRNLSGIPGGKHFLLLLFRRIQNGVGARQKNRLSIWRNSVFLRNPLRKGQGNLRNGTCLILKHKENLT